MTPTPPQCVCLVLACWEYAEQWRGEAGYSVRALNPGLVNGLREVGTGTTPAAAWLAAARTAVREIEKETNR